jgi:hypothetical protein
MRVPIHWQWHGRRACAVCCSNELSKISWQNTWARLITLELPVKLKRVRQLKEEYERAHKWFVFWRRVYSHASCCSEVVPLGFQVEWANARAAIRIPPFRHRSGHAQDRIRLEYIVFHRSNPPCDMECQEYQAIHTPEGIFLPLGALLAALYRSCEISRPVFQLLSEIVAVVPLHTARSQTLSPPRACFQPKQKRRDFV